MLYDYHVHSSYSDDAESTMSRMAEAAVQAGAAGLCFTDHVDLDGIEGRFNPHAWRKEEYFAAFDEARARFGNRLSLRLGIELGEANHYPDIGRSIAAEIPDFIIGSIHNLRDTPDFYCGRAGGEASGMYADRDRCRTLLERYMDELEETGQLGCFDVIGHIGYPLRYMRSLYPELTLEPLRERLAQLFRRLAEGGKGIELNCSGLRQSLGETMPSGAILSLYRDMGGEIVTLGSDAHCTEHIGMGIDEGKKLLKGLGFIYYCVYNKREPEFIKL